MIPTEFNPASPSFAEKFIFNQLKKSFYENVIVFHSFDLLARNKQNRNIDAEIDFLILHPQFGILVLEVKGGVIKYSNGLWYQNDKKLERSPDNQAKQNKFNIKKFLTQRLGIEPPVSFGHSICFPDCNFKIENLPINIEGITISGNHIEYLEESLISIMRNFNIESLAKIEKVMYRTIKKHLMSEFEYGSTFSDKILVEERMIFNLTERQCELLVFISEYNKALIKGCAGSGKTIMAVKKTKELVASEKSVLLLCYNIMLAEQLKNELAEYNSVTVSTYHQFCIDHLKTKGIEINSKDKPESYWIEDIPNMFFELQEEQPIKFDALIIDEGQDFREEYWISLLDLVKSDGYFYVFYDPDQNLFKTKMKFPEQLGTPFLLNKNCRSTKNIFNKLKDLASFDIKISEEAFEGENITIYNNSDVRQRRNYLSKTLHDLVENQNIKKNQIVILGAHKIKNTCIGESNSVGKFQITENTQSGNNSISYFTFMKYKGLESDVVILLDIDIDDPRWNEVGLYTGISRAKHIVYMIYQ